MELSRRDASSSFLVVGFLIPLMICAVDAQTASMPRGDATQTGSLGTSADSPHKLNFMLEPAESYDTDVPGALQGRLGSYELQEGGYSTMLNGNVDYAWRRPASLFTVNESSAVRYYNRLETVKSVAHSAALGFELGPQDGRILSLHQSASYAPSYLYRLFPTATPPEVGVPVDAALDYRVNDVPSYAYSSRVMLGRGTKRRGRLSGTGEFDRTDFQGEQQLQQIRPDLKTYGAGVIFDHGAARNVGLSLGYHYRTGEFGYGPRTTEQVVSFGVDYSRALSTTRRANFGFHLGPSRLSIPGSADRPSIAGDLYRVSADASYSAQLLRSWVVGMNARRRLEYIASLRQPVFADGVGVNVGGFVTSATSVSAAAAYSKGASALNREAMEFDSYTGDVRVQRELTRTVAGYGEYLYYFYDFGNASRVPLGVPPRFERHSVRAGLTLSIQALGK